MRRKAPTRQAASVVILNTCAVREKAQDKVFSALGVLARRKQDDPNLVVGVTGCVAQVSGPEILERAPWVDFVAGTGQVEKVGELVAAARAQRRQAMVLDLPEEDPVYQFRQISRGSAFQAYVTVIEGCEQYCTFCIVPFTRGRERSRAAAEIVDEVRHLAGQAYTEVTLLGQTVNAYREPVEGFGLGELLRRVGRVPGLRRLRFITSHPRFVDEALLGALSEVENLAPYLHLPAQSGSDRVLSRMKRRYTSAEYRSVVGPHPRPGAQGSRCPRTSSSDSRARPTSTSRRRWRSSGKSGSRASSASATRRGPAPPRRGGGARSRCPRRSRPGGSRRSSTSRPGSSGRRTRGSSAASSRSSSRAGTATGRRPAARRATGSCTSSRIPRADALAPGGYVRVRITRGLPNSLAGRLAA